MLPLVGESGRSAPEARSMPSCASSEVSVVTAVADLEGVPEGTPWRWLGVVLCGGASRRMGRDKAQLELDGEPFYARAAGVLEEVCAEVVLASGPTARLADPRWREVADAQPGEVGHDVDRTRAGPLAALVAGLGLAAREGFDGIVCAPCDVPHLALAVLRPLQRAVEANGRGLGPGAPEPAVDVAHWRRGDRDEPLCAALSVRALAPLRAAFRRGVRRPTVAFAELRATVREAPPGLAEALTNVNTPEELALLPRRGAVAGSAQPGCTDGSHAAVDGDGRMGDVA
jgi:molybdopterin-guanine dinucleotide biosynthesis protein A